MMRRPFSLLVCALLAGCAQAPVADLPVAAPAAETPGLGDHVLALNPEAGHFKELTQEVFEGAEYGIDLTIAQANRDPKWASKGALCLDVPESPLRTCIGLQVLAPPSEKIVVTKTVRRDTERLEDTILPGAFRIGETIPVYVHVVADGFALRVGNEQPLTIPLEGTATRMLLFCSSALCRFRLKEADGWNSK
jgi:hypothetical protein